MQDIITQTLTYILLGIINIGIGYFFIWLRGWLKKHNVIKTLEANETLVKIAVKAVQEGFHELDGHLKFQIAKDYIIESASQKGLKIDENDIDWLIDAAVRELKITFPDWNIKK